MHITYKMQEILDIDSYCRVREVLVVFQKFHCIVNGRNRISCFRVRRIFEAFIHSGHMPLGSKSIFRGMTILIHPFGIIHDGVVPEILFDYFSCGRSKVIISNLSYSLVTLSSPTEGRTAHKQSGHHNKYTSSHQSCLPTERR